MKVVNMMRKLLLILILAGLLSACTAEPAAIDPGAGHTSAAETASAYATATPSPQPSATPTGTPTPTVTATPTATFTPTATASPTPDLRVIDGDPHDFLLSPADLPAEARYYLPYSSWLSPNRNSEVLFDWGTTAGQAYLEATGRVDGWVVNYLRGTTALIGPEQVFNNAVLYRSSAGAQLVIEQYTPCSDPESGYSLQESNLEIGDVTRVCLKQEPQPNGQNRVWYRIEFVYRNFYHAVMGQGWELEVRLEFVEAVARTLFARLVAAPLVEQVTFVP